MRLGLVAVMLFAAAFAASALGIGWGARVDISPIDKVAAPSIAWSGYLDMTYAQLVLGYRMQHGDAANAGSDLGWLDTVALLKWPFTIGTTTAFPQAGIEYGWCLSYVDSSGRDLTTALTSAERQQLNIFWLEAGVGADFLLTAEPHTGVKWNLRIGAQLRYDPFDNHYGLQVDLLYGCAFPSS